MKCLYCYRRVRKKDEFCPSCGVRLYENTVSETPKPVSQYSPNPPQMPATPASSEKNFQQKADLTPTEQQDSSANAASASTGLIIGFLALLTAYPFWLLGFLFGIPGLILALNHLKKNGTMVSLLSVFVSGLAIIIAIISLIVRGPYM